MRKRTMRLVRTALFLSAAWIAGLSGCAGTQERQMRDVAALSGLEMYQQLCASCHGVSGRGDGPVASLIEGSVLDLTRIAWRDGGVFPEEDVRRIIDGRYERPAHGPRDMPVWGWRFYDSAVMDDSAERARVDALIQRLVDYIRSIQISGD